MQATKKWERDTEEQTRSEDTVEPQGQAGPTTSGTERCGEGGNGKMRLWLDPRGRGGGGTVQQEQGGEGWMGCDEGRAWDRGTGAWLRERVVGVVKGRNARVEDHRMMGGGVR